MRLSRNLCLGGRFNGRIIKGIKYKGYHIYPNTYSDYNIYLVEIPIGGATLYFDNMPRGTKTRKPYYDFGDGVKNPELGSITVFDRSCTTYHYEEAGTYQIITTEYLLNPGNKHYLREVIALRSDLSNANNLLQMNWGFKSFENIQLDALEEITSMNSMFYDCADLEEVSFANSSLPKLTTISSMFSECANLKTVDFSHCDLSSLTNMSDTFDGCPNLEMVDFSYCNLSGLTSLHDVFENASFKRINFTGATFGPITSMWRAFYNNSSLIEIDLSMLDTSQTTNITSLFYNCTSLETVNLSNFDLINLTNSTYAFSGCSSLHTIRLDNCSSDTISKIIYISSFPKGELEGVTRTIYCKEENIPGEPPNGWRFEEPPVEPDVPIEPPVEPEEIPLYVSGEFRGRDDITEVRTMVDSSQNASHIDLTNMFNGCTNLVSVNTEDWEVSFVEDMSYMFYNCSSLTELDLSNWHLGGPDTYNMFAGCTSLHTIRLDNCHNSTVYMLLTNSGLPDNKIDNVTRTIYVKKSEVTSGLIVNCPTNWVFSYVD